METLLSGAHAVMVYDSDEDLQAVACGNIGGAMMGDTLVVGLAEMGVPGHTGCPVPPGWRSDDGDDPLRAWPLPSLGIRRNGRSRHGAMDDMSGMDMATPAP